MAGSNYTVQVNSGVTGLMLPGKGTRYDAGAQVDLTPTQFRQISPARMALLTLLSEPTAGGGGGGGGVAFNETFQDDWDPATGNTEGQVVRKNDALYVADADAPAGTDPADGAPWRLILAAPAGGGAGGGAAFNDAFQGEWDPGVTYTAGQVVTQFGGLYVADGPTTEDDIPSAVGAPVDIGGLGVRADAASFTGSAGQHWTTFTMGASAASVAEVEMWAASGQTVPAGAVLGIYTANRVTPLATGVAPGGPFADGFRAVLSSPVTLLADTDYAIYTTLSFHVGMDVSSPFVPDGVVAAIGGSFTTDYGASSAYALPFRLYAPAATDSPWRKVIQGT